MERVDVEEMIGLLMKGESYTLVTDDRRLVLAAENGAIRIIPSGEANVSEEKEAREIAAFFLAYAEYKRRGSW